jgi:hypothetical protein
VIVLGGGAAGLFAAGLIGQRGRSVVVLERNRDVAAKVRISGGGRCNFTNRNASPANFISANPDFCRSALARYSAADFIALVERHRIPYHEKTLGQLFCDDSSQRIIDLLMEECRRGKVEIRTGVEVEHVRRGTQFEVETDRGTFVAPALIVATGGLSVPKLGATDLGYRIARQFDIRIVPPRPGLVPFKLQKGPGRSFSELAGISLEARISCGDGSFREKILFTHRGLSGPAVLQASSYWDVSTPVTIDLIPDLPLRRLLEAHPDRTLGNALASVLPKRFVDWWMEDERQRSIPVRSMNGKQVDVIERSLHGWSVTPSGTEGFAKAEVTVGGVDTRELSSKTMEARNVRGLFYIGEVMDVTGWLGGYNFQWAWSSARAAAEAVTGSAR